MTTTTSEFRVKVEGPGITVDQTVARETAERVLRVMFGGSEQAGTYDGSAGGGGGKRDSTAADGAVRPHQFVEKHQAKQIPEKIVTLGTYMETHQEKRTFSRGDLFNAFEGAGEPPPKNLPRDVKTTLKRKWIAEQRDTPGQFYVTQKGKKALAANFKEARKRGPRRKKMKGKTA